MDFGFSLFPKLFAERSDFPLTTGKHSYEGHEFAQIPFLSLFLGQIPVPEKLKNLVFEINRLVVLFIV